MLRLLRVVGGWLQERRLLVDGRVLLLRCGLPEDGLLRCGLSRDGLLLYGLLDVWLLRIAALLKLRWHGRHVPLLRVRRSILIRIGVLLRLRRSWHAGSIRQLLLSWYRRLITIPITCSLGSRLVVGYGTGSSRDAVQLIWILATALVLLLS